MTPDERQLIYSLIITGPAGKRRLTREDFAIRFPRALDGGALASEILESAEVEKCSEDLMAALVVAAAFGISRDQLSALSRLLGESWHDSHEDIVGILQKLKAPESVEALFRVASLSGQAGSNDALGRKCTWALADIGTAEAKSRLEHLALCENRSLAECARRRLERWDDELGRKGVSQ